MARDTSRPMSTSLQPAAAAATFMKTWPTRRACRVARLSVQEKGNTESRRHSLPARENILVFLQRAPDVSPFSSFTASSLPPSLSPSVFIALMIWINKVGAANEEYMAPRDSPRTWSTGAARSPPELPRWDVSCLPTNKRDQSRFQNLPLRSAAGFGGTAQ